MNRRPCKHVIKDIESITCPYCNKSGFKMLHWGHLKKVHNKTLEEVLIEFPGHPTMTKVESDKRSDVRIKCNKKVTETCNKKYGGVGFKSKKLKEKTVDSIEKKFGFKNVMKVEKFKFTGDKNPMKNEETAKKVSKTMTGKPSKLKGKKYREIHGPEKAKKLIEDKRISGAIAYSKVTNPSKPQVELFNLTKELYPQAIINFPIVGFCIDIAIIDKKIAIEYDGSYWHQDIEKDLKRQKGLENLGWKFVRYMDYIPTKEELIQDINKII